MMPFPDFDEDDPAIRAMRWRMRAEAAEARVAELESGIDEVLRMLASVYRNEHVVAWLKKVRGVEAGVAQKVREGSGESTPETTPAAVQAVTEQRACNPCVPGSTPGSSLDPMHQGPSEARSIDLDTIGRGLILKTIDWIEYYQTCPFCPAGTPDDDGGDQNHNDECPLEGFDMTKDVEALRSAAKQCTKEATFDYDEKDYDSLDKSMADYPRPNEAQVITEESKWPCFWCGSMQAHFTGYPGGLSTVPACEEHAKQYPREKAFGERKARTDSPLHDPMLDEPGPERAIIEVEIAQRGATMTHVGVRVERSAFLAIGWVPNDKLRTEPAKAKPELPHAKAEWLRSWAIKIIEAMGGAASEEAHYLEDVKRTMGLLECFADTMSKEARSPRDTAYCAACLDTGCTECDTLPDEHQTNNAAPRPEHCKPCLSRPHLRGCVCACSVCTAARESLEQEYQARFDAGGVKVMNLSDALKLPPVPDEKKP